MKKIVIVGATSRIAEHCARIFVEKPVQLTLIARDLRRATALADDLRVRSPGSEVRAITAEFIRPSAIRSVVDEVCAGGNVDHVLIAHGTLPDQRECEQNLELVADTLTLNAVSPALFAEAFARHMERAGHGTLAIIGSVAGDRGRKSNYVYGAAKAFVDHYVQGMQHRFAGTPVNVTLIKPGPTDTPMTAHLQVSGRRMASAPAVARRIVSGMERGARVIYTPIHWKLIMTVVRYLPWFIFKRTNF